MNTQIAEIVTVRGGYRVKLGKAVHIVDKQRRCSCAQQHCPAVKAVALYLQAGGQRAPEARATPPFDTFPCPMCQAPASGSIESNNWRCSADRSHYWAWRTAQLRAAHAEALQHASPYKLEVLAAFASDEARAKFLKVHALTYPAGA